MPWKPFAWRTSALGSLMMVFCACVVSIKKLPINHKKSDLHMGVVCLSHWTSEYKAILIAMRDAARAAGMGITDDAVAFIMDIAPTAGMRGEFFIDGEISVAAAAGVDLAVVGGEIVTVVVATAAGMDRETAGRTADIGVGATRLGDGQVADGEFTVEIAAAGKVHLQAIAVNGVLDIDIAAPGSRQLIQGLTGYVGLEMFAHPVPPMVAVIFHIDMEDPVVHFGDDPVAVLGFGGAYRNGFLATLAKVEIDATGNPDTMKTLNIAFLGISIVDDLTILRKGEQGGKGKKAQ